ncbi:hypothetical protein HELRODRAFT_174423 [Helobdella robusta]|uniref:DUF4590 domain-containing protein n=1 Tax=Helobdella robusta TaxID=6412 RepID=T1F840_HELRO|nr:hypothetical protein HELRODRAFT_174423 [Helobdella robusta]ESO02946.1 hypothetical protein HELRODRAFT_174423 [Helobdella robusta]
MDHKKSSLETYNSLTDPNLGAYFSKQKIQKHLKKSGLISKRGIIIPENELKSRLIKEEKEEKMKMMLLQEVMERSYEEEKRHQQIIKQKFDEIAKLEAVVLRKPINRKFSKLQKSFSMSTLSSASLKRSRSAPKNSLRNVASAKNSRQLPCIITLYYYGRKHVSNSNNMDYIKVEQQVSEMASVIVFRGPVSYKRLVYCSVSSCCEYKHRMGSKIGGRKGLFKFNGVSGGNMCSCCKVALDLKKSTKNNKEVNMENKETLLKSEDAPFTPCDNKSQNNVDARPRSLKSKFSKKIKKKENLTSSLCQTDTHLPDKVIKVSSYTSTETGDDEMARFNIEKNHKHHDHTKVDDNLDTNRKAEEHKNDTVFKTTKKEHDIPSSSSRCSCSSSDDEDKFCEHCKSGNDDSQKVHNRRNVDSPEKEKIYGRNKNKNNESDCDVISGSSSRSNSRDSNSTRSSSNSSDGGKRSIQNKKYINLNNDISKKKRQTHSSESDGN